MPRPSSVLVLRGVVLGPLVDQLGAALHVGGVREVAVAETGPFAALPASAPADSEPLAHGGLSTSANWSKTGMQVPKRSNAPMFAALVGVGLLVLGGGAFAAFKVMQSSSPAAATSAAASAGASAEVVDQAPSTEVTPVAPSAAPPDLSDPAVANPPSAPLSATNMPEAPVAKTPAARQVVARGAPRHAAPAVAAPAPSPAVPAPVAVPAKKKSSNTTDFGY